MAHIVRSMDGMNAGKKYPKCPACSILFVNSDYIALENEQICTKCETVYHKDCGLKTNCCQLWRCKQCAEYCNIKKHWQCQLNCNEIYCECK